MNNELKGLLQEFSEKLVSYDFEGAYTVAGALGSYLRRAEETGVNPQTIELLQYKVRDFFAINREMQTLRRRMIAIGHSVKDIR